jgi:hypothetical protein
MRKLPPSFIVWALVSMTIGWFVFPVRFEWATTSVAVSALVWISGPLVLVRWTAPLTWKRFTLIAMIVGGFGALLLYGKLRAFDVARSDTARLEDRLVGLSEAAHQTIETVESAGAAGLMGMFVAGIVLGALAGIASAAILTRPWSRTRMRDDRAHDLLCLTGALTAGFGAATVASMATPVWILMIRTEGAMRPTRNSVPPELIGEFLGFTFFAVLGGSLTALALWGAYLALHAGVGLISNSRRKQSAPARLPSP